MSLVKAVSVFSMQFVFMCVLSISGVFPERTCEPAGTVTGATIIILSLFLAAWAAIVIVDKVDKKISER